MFPHSVLTFLHVSILWCVFLVYACALVLHSSLQLNYPTEEHAQCVCNGKPIAPARCTMHLPCTPQVYALHMRMYSTNT